MRFHINPVARAVGIFGVVAALAAGVTYAALNSSATLTDNTLETSANLNVYDFSQNQWDQSAPGFTITNFVPGQGATEHFYLQNNGGVPLNVTVTVPNPPAEPGNGYGFSGWDNLTVSFHGDNCNGDNNVTMADLLAGPVTLPCNTLNPGDSGDSNTTNHVGNYTVKFDINPSAITGDHAGVGNFDMVFTGTQT